MQLKDINRNEMAEHKKRVEKHKKAIESDVKETMTQEKTTNENLAVKKKAVKNRTIDKKAMKEKQKIIEERVMGDARQEKINIEKNPLEKDLEEGQEEPKVVITKEERAERFKKLHALAQGVIKKWNE